MMISWKGKDSNNDMGAITLGSFRLVTEMSNGINNSKEYGW